MKKKRMLLFIVPILLGVIFAKETSMSIDKMPLSPERISPYVLVTEARSFFSWDQVSKPNSFAYNGNGGFGFATIDKNLHISYKPVKKGFPSTRTEFHSAGDGLILWGKEGYRGVWALDTDSLYSVTGVASSDVDTDLKRGYVPFSDKPWLLMTMYKSSLDADNLTSSIYSCIDLSTGEFVFEKEEIGNICGPETQEYLFMIPQGNGELYGLKCYRLPQIMKYDWVLFLINEHGFSKPYQNKLTKALSEKNFGLTLWKQEIKRWDLKTRYMFGIVQLPDSVPSPFAMGIVPSVVRWDEKMEEITITPLTAHIPKGYRILGAWAVSPNGEWAKCGLKSIGDSKTYYNCFFHLSDAYPLGVSPPIIGATSQGLTGIFVETTDQGTLYLDRPATGTIEQKQNAILVYKMNECFESLKAQAAAKAAEILKY